MIGLQRTGHEERKMVRGVDGMELAPLPVIHAAEDAVVTPTGAGRGELILELLDRMVQTIEGLR